MKLIDEKEVEEVAKMQLKMTLNVLRTFKDGVNFAEQKLLPLMVEFKNWCDENEVEIRLDNINTNNSAITTEQLLEQFLKTRTK